MSSNPTKQLILKLLSSKPKGERGTLSNVLRKTLKKKQHLLKLARNCPTPFYVIDQSELINDIKQFKTSFDKYLPSHEAFYAIKSNYHPHILKTAVRHGLNLDASSAREIKLALKAGAKKILFSGPGKSAEELKFAVKNHKKVTVNLDGFEELKRLAALTKSNNGKKIRCGIRFFSGHHGAWSKFGIPLKDLSKFWRLAKRYKNIDLRGIQFHTSHNINPEKQQHVLIELAQHLKADFTAKERAQIEFIDIGGGYFPDKVEGFYPWSHHYPWSLSGGYLEKLAADHYGIQSQPNKEKYFITRATPLAQFAKAIGKTIRDQFSTLVNCAFYTEPGRIICNNSTYIVMRIMDSKPPVTITDGGINMTGWEFGMNLYYPIINLSHPAKKEISTKIYGSLCTPRDFWGYYIFANKNTAGDIITIPNQGSYKFTLAQEFIKPIPKTYILK